jgi:NAD(P)-dependent dehydrogenase (short-subunit alcohol dehydrogenase family)
LFRSALVTGGRSGIGAAVVEALERQGCDVRVLDLADGFDVGEPAAWGGIERVEFAFLNAGVVTGTRLVARLTDEQYRRIMRANVDGVVLGVRRLARVMREGDSIVVTASLAGLTAAEPDPIYTLTKHGVVGFVRSVAPQLAERGIRINMVNPGFVETPLLRDDELETFRAAGFPLLTPAEVADAVLAAAVDGEVGQAWVVQPGREPLKFRFPGVPGPRVPGAEGVLPPL